MKEGYVIKGNRQPQPDDLDQINRYTRREFKADEIYAFSVVLCDNEVDRDGERFTTDALKKLAVLFLGKTGIFNHSMQAQNQTARIYSCRVEQDDSRRTKCGETYHRLVAKAYLPKSEKNSDFILELESGIKKEVSVGCAVAKVTCSICGADLKKSGCDHEKGRLYNGKLCCAQLSEPTDAYEWSFVAVPAQPEAGVIKNFALETGDVEKALAQCGEQITLSKAQAQSLAQRISRLTEEAECGKSYRAELEQSLLRCTGILEPGIPAATVKRMAQGLCLGDLKCMEAACRQKAEKVLPLRPQLAPERREEPSEQNSQFKI